jgi:nucleoside-diphosphate-sugar epimerase
MTNADIVLVTGGTGFVSMQIILQLLQKGYKVRTTLRSLKDRDKITGSLQSNGIKVLDNLSFVKAELIFSDYFCFAFFWAISFFFCDESSQLHKRMPK